MILPALALSFFLAAGFAQAAPLFKADTFYLDNGMEAVVLENHRAPVVSHMVWYKTGGIDDKTGKGGTAHLLEHLMFKGTKKVPDGAFSKIVARRGGEENAFTSADFTAYYQNIAKDGLETVMFLEADRMKNLTLTPEDFAPERQVVAEERLMRYDNSPEASFTERKRSILWAAHPYADAVIGTRAEIADLELSDVLDFYNARYAPDNAILVVAGDVTADEVKTLAHKYYGVVPPARNPVLKRVFPAPPNVKTRLEMTHPQAKTKLVTKDYIVPSLNGEDKKLPAAFEVLKEVLNAAHAGVFYKRLIAPRKAIATGASYNGFALDRATFSIYARADANADEKSLETALSEAFDSLENRLTDQEVEKAKKRLTAGMEYVDDSPETLANIVGMTRVLGLDLNEILLYREKIAAVTTRDVLDARRYLNSAPQISGVLLPERTP